MFVSIKASREIELQDQKAHISRIAFYGVSGWKPKKIVKDEEEPSWRCLNYLVNRLIDDFNAVGSLAINSGARFFPSINLYFCAIRFPNPKHIRASEKKIGQIGGEGKEAEDLPLNWVER